MARVGRLARQHREQADDTGIRLVVRDQAEHAGEELKPALAGRAATEEAFAVQPVAFFEHSLEQGFLCREMMQQPGAGHTAVGGDLKHARVPVAEDAERMEGRLDDLRSQVDFTDTFNSAPSKPKPRKSYSDFDDVDEISAPKFQPPPPPEEAGDGLSGPPS